MADQDQPSSGANNGTAATESGDGLSTLSDAAIGTLPLEAIDDIQTQMQAAAEFLIRGGPAIWAIGMLSVIAATVILWKIWRLSLLGAWSKGEARDAVDAVRVGDSAAALQIVEGRLGIRSQLVEAALNARETLPHADAREETTRVAKNALAEARSGLRALELIATIAPLLGLLGTVLGMIEAFQSLQDAGTRADPSALAGGIWEALLTTAAGMAVAIPVSAALTWFESVIDRIKLDMEDAATRIFISQTRAARQEVKSGQ